jgi:signal transduction histidine kinase
VHIIKNNDIPARPLPEALLVLGSALTVVDAYLAIRWSTRTPWYRVNEIIQMSAWLAVGYFACRLPRRRTIGLLMMGFGLVLAGNAPVALGTPPGLAAQIAQPVGDVLFGLQLPVAATIFLAYPGGVIKDWLDRAYLAVAYVLGFSVGIALSVAADQDQVWRVNAVLSLITVVAGLLLVVRRARRSSRRERRIFRFPLAGLLIAVLVFAAWQGGFLVPLRGPTVELMQVASVIALPITFLLGLVRQMSDEAGVARLIRDLRHTPVDRLESALAGLLDDPELRLIMPAGGEPAGPPPVPAGRHVDVIGDPGTPLALLVRDRGLCDEPTLMGATREAVRFVLDNNHLRASLQLRTDEVTATSRRLVNAGDAARRRIEQDIHDGVQQRLLAAGMALSRLRRKLAVNEELAVLLAAAEGELTSAFTDLRDLSHGIHPAVLTTHGLSAALADLIARIPAPVRPDLAPDLPRLPPDVEATAYFLVCEALANVMKHAHAQHVDVRTRWAEGQLLISVTDDGCGGAVAAAGITGLHDRVAAVGGAIRLVSPRGRGTTVEARLPCG